MKICKITPEMLNSAENRAASIGIDHVCGSYFKLLTWKRFPANEMASDIADAPYAIAEQGLHQSFNRSETIVDPNAMVMITSPCIEIGRLLADLYEARCHIDAEHVAEWSERNIKRAIREREAEIAREEEVQK